MGSRANLSVGDLTAKVDGQSAEVSKQATVMIVTAVRLLRIPTALMLWFPVPFIAATLLVGLLSDGVAAVVVLVAGLLMAAVSAAFWARRRRIIAAVDDPAKLATELGIMISLSGKVDETRGALAQISGGGGWRMFTRLQGLWKGVTMPGHWIDGIGDLPRARYFGPPKVGTTVTLTFAALWLVPISVVVALLSLVGSLAGTL